MSLTVPMKQYKELEDERDRLRKAHRECVDIASYDGLWRTNATLRDLLQDWLDWWDGELRYEGLPPFVTSTRRALEGTSDE